MSKIGKKPVKIPEGIKVEIKEGIIVFQNEKGKSLKIPILSGIKAVIENNNLIFKPENNNKQTRSNWGTIRSLSNNAVIGLTSGFEKVLEIKGLGYRAAKENDKIVFQLGFSHPIEFKIPDDLEIEVEGNNIIKIRGIDKSRVGEIAAQIRKFRKPEPYKGKGIRYQGEFIKLKAGKKAIKNAG